MACSTFYDLPDTLAHWPWPRRIHPRAESIVAESADWLRAFRAFNDRSQRAFDNCNVALAGALIYPFSSEGLLRTGCDLANLIFVFDLYTDVEDAKGCRAMANIVVDALQHPFMPRPKEETSLGEITRRFWLRAIESGEVGPVAQRRFVEYFTTYVMSVVDEAADRDGDVYRSVNDYLDIRHETAGFYPLYAFMLQELPDEVANHPAMVEMSLCVTDMLIIDNDIISYNTEQSVGDVRHNLVTVTMLERALTIHDAIALLAKQHTALQERFLAAYKSFDFEWDAATNEQLKRTLRDLANFPRGIYCWHFEGGRYFGSRGGEISASRRVVLLPRLPSGGRREDTAIPYIDEMWGVAISLEGKV